MMINRSIQKMIAIALVFLGLICGFKGASAAELPTYSSAAADIPQIALQSTAPISLAGNWLFQPDLQADASVLSLSPAQSQLPTLPNDRWQPIAVPANWYLQGQNIAGTAWYQYRFNPTGNIRHKVVKLVFDGVDYAADVWLNGQYLGFHEGYFQPFSFIVTDSLKPGQINQLTVKVNSPRELEQPDWSLHKRLIKGIFAHHDARPGGAWTARSQDDNTGGIWAPVSFQVSEQVAIDAVQITPHIKISSAEAHSAQAIAEVNLTVSVPLSESVNASAQKASKEIQATLQLVPENFPGRSSKKILTSLQLHPGENHVSVQINQPSPHLWWTWDHGSPDLYRLEVQLSEGSQILDRRREVFGFRSIEYEPHSKVWLLNGRRMFVRGTNYIATQWLSEMTNQDYQRDIDLIAQANINAVRVHGHVTAQPFYRLCDRAGLLIWQDFPLQWGYRDDPEFAAEALHQAKDMIALLYNHPSIMAWSLHNEPPWDAGWMRKTYQQYDPEQNHFLDEFLYSHLKNVDSSRYLHPISSTSEHPWWGWYSRVSCNMQNQPISR
jgi:beta-mannosidase